MTPRSLLAPGRLAGRPVLRSQTDERLVDLARAGCDPAFEAIVARYRRPLLRYCARILPPDRAEDAVQQTFVNAYDAMRRSARAPQLRPWLYRIAHNNSLNALRDRGLDHEELDERYDGVERPDQALERRQSVQSVVGAVQGLPERQRDAIVLRELEGRSYDEIAGELGVSGGAVRQLLNRARNTLRAGATALTPAGLLKRIPWADSGEPVATRVAELTAAGGAGALAAKACATALVTGAVVGGAAVTPHGDPNDEASARSGPGAARPAASPTAGEAAAYRALGGRARGPGGRRGEGRHDRRSGSSRDGTDDSERRGRKSGPGSGDGEGGSGGGSSGSGSGSSGSGGGSSGSGSSGSGSGGDSSGSGGDSSGSGSGSSGSGSSGSGSGTSGSDSSGSGSGGDGSGSDSDSGSGSSGSGSDSSGSGSGDDSD